jgi:hypothetical protein
MASDSAALVDSDECISEGKEILTVSAISMGDWVEVIESRQRGRVVRTDRQIEQYLVRFRSFPERWFASRELKVRLESPLLEEPVTMIDGVEIGSDIEFFNEQGERLKGKVIGYNLRQGT